MFLCFRRETRARPADGSLSFLLKIRPANLGSVLRSVEKWDLRLFETGYGDGVANFSVKLSKRVMTGVSTSMSFFDRWIRNSIKILSMPSSTALSRKVLRWSRDLMRNGALLLIETYRLILSPLLGGACRFEPSCSVYAKEAFQKHDPGTALILSMKRIGRCRPGGPFGFDPVPEASCTCTRGHHEFAK